MSASTFTIITVLAGDVSASAVERCGASVLAQNYEGWQWTIIDTTPGDDPVQFVVKALSSDPRISVRHASPADSAALLNLGLRAADGDFVTVLDSSDTLDPSAIGVLNHHLWLRPEIDIMYGDEGSVDPDTGHVITHRRPHWSPERFLNEDFCSRTATIRRSFALTLDGWRHGFEGAEHYDLLLRAVEQSDRVIHVSHTITFTQSDPPASHSADSRRRAAADALKRRRIEGEVVDVGHGIHCVRRRPTASPLVSVIVPTRGTVGSLWGLDLPLVVNMLDSVRQCSTYLNLEFIVVYDTSTSDAVLSEVQRVCEKVRLVPYDEPFNFSKKCNIGALEASGEILVFMNDDMEVGTADWVESMIAFLEDPDVGLVGPMLLYDNFLVQSAGHAGAPPNNYGRGRSPIVTSANDAAFAVNREVMGVTGACMAIRRDLFFEMGGLSTLFPLNFNDIDFGFKVIEAGYRIIWTPTAQLFHFESMTRETAVSYPEIELLNRLWGRYLQFDPLAPADADQSGF